MEKKFPNSNLLKTLQHPQSRNNFPTNFKFQKYFIFGDVTPSSNPIRCAKKDNERKYPGRGIGTEGNNERKKPFKSKCASIMNLGLLHGLCVTKFISMNTFVEGQIDA
jgi:hypothetical protein